jgi:hypothetical protein
MLKNSERVAEREAEMGLEIEVEIEVGSMGKVKANGMNGS